MGDVEAEREDARVDHAGAIDAWRAAAASAAVALAVLGVGVGEARARLAHRANDSRIEEPEARTAPAPTPAPPPAPAPEPTIAAPWIPWGGILSEPGLSAGARSLGPGVAAHAANVRTAGRPVVQGRLPPEVIARIVSYSSGPARLCYERALRANPRLSGRIEVKFVIDRSGAVSTAAEGPGSTLPDEGVIGCVVSSFLALSFPRPEDGIATVVVRLVLSPPD
jgi:hypothetical protein